jgi:signal transduction histidine kinase
MEGIDRAAALTQRILSFSRRQTLSPAPTDLDELVRGMDELIRSSLRENIEFEHRSTAHWRVVVDRNQMENVILNLVINARDAMPNGGAVCIETDDVALLPETARALSVEEGDYVRLTVRDTGTGMSDAVRAKALDPFFATKPVGQGTGLGLSTTFGFVVQSGGQMQIESTPGSGTAIVIFLPRLVTDGEPSSTGSTG